MSDPLDITDEEAAGLARLAQAQLRLATRLSERALDEPDVEAACHLARASERVARGYRQSLLLKSRLKRDREAPSHQADARPVLPARREARTYQRIREVHAAVERIIEERAEALEPGEAEDIRLVLLEVLQAEARNERFLVEPIETVVARMCETFDLPLPDSVAPQPAGPDSS